MKNVCLVTLIIGIPFFLGAQDLNIAFTSAVDSIEVESVTATNMRTFESISLPGNDTLILSSSTGIHNPEQFEDMLLFPNPFNGQTKVTIFLNYPQNVTINVRNIMGQVIRQSMFKVSAGQSNFQIRVKSPGVYFVTTTYEGRSISQKAICSYSQHPDNRIQYISSEYMKAANHNDLQEKHILGFRAGDLIHYKCQSSIYTTIIADKPSTSKEYIVEFYPCTDLDGLSYPVTKIGEQVWMAQNLAYLPYINSIYSLSTAPSYFVYDVYGNSQGNTKSFGNYEIYGVLYNWSAAKTACPDGWHLPTKQEWLNLFNEFNYKAGYKIRDKSGQYWLRGNSRNTDEVAFTALPGGELYPYIESNNYLNVDPGFLNLRSKATFWTNTLEDFSVRSGQSPVYFMLDDSQRGYSYNHEHSYRQTHYLYPSVNTSTSGYSVRCVLGGKLTPPVPQINEVTEITDSSFTISGRILNNGGAEISQVGFCWSDHEGVSIEDNISTHDFQNDVFHNTITGLLANTTYHVNVYGINSEGIGYGDEIAVTTAVGRAKVLTSYIVQVTDTSAVLGGAIVTNGGSEIAKLGFCWAEHTNPSFDDNVIDCTTSDSTYHTSIHNLSPQSSYYVKAFAINAADTSFGEVLKLKTAEGSFMYQGDTYGYLTIGKQVWMNQNLRYLPEVSPPNDKSYDSPRYYVYNYDNSDVDHAKLTENYIKYGVLYNWFAAMQLESASDDTPSNVKGICPPGWHLPSKGEFEILKTIAGDEVEDYKSDFDWFGYTDNGTNLSGFNALPGGQCLSDFCDRKNSLAGFWTTTYDNDYGPFHCSIDRNISIFAYYTSIGFSVRCIQNDNTENAPPRAALTVNREIGTPEDDITFDASESYDYETPLEELLCRWDWDSDGIWDTEPEKQLVKTHLFTERGNYVVRMEIMDGQGLTDTLDQVITIGDGSFIDSRDQTEYVFVNIENQIWMAENLKYLPSVHSYYNGSDTLPYYYVNESWNENIESAKSHANYKKYGTLYNWVAAQTACPEGWHLPSDEEWFQLETSLGMSTSESLVFDWRESGKVGQKLKSQSGWEYSGNGTNSSIFTALPGGIRYSTGDPNSGGVSEPGMGTSFWTPTQNETQAIMRRILYSNDAVLREYYPLNHGYSVRCLKD